MIECNVHKNRDVVREEVVPGSGEVHHRSCDNGEKTL